jgi:hypothetical protein
LKFLYFYFFNSKVAITETSFTSIRSHSKRKKMPQEARKAHGGARISQREVDEGEAYTVRKGLYKEILANSHGVDLDSAQRQIEDILVDGRIEGSFIEKLLTELYGVIRKEEVAKQVAKEVAKEVAEQLANKEAAINEAANQVSLMGFDQNLVDEAKVQRISNVNDMIEWIETEEKKRLVLSQSKPTFEPEPEPEPEPEMNPRSSK